MYIHVCQFSLKSFTTFVRVHVRLGGGVKKISYLNFASKKKLYLKQFVGVVSEYAITPAIGYLPPLPLPRDNNWVSGVSVCCV